MISRAPRTALVPRAAPPTSRPVDARPRRLRIDDWLIACAFGCFPLLGLAITAGQGLTLAGVGILLWAGHRAPISERRRDAHRATGLAALLAVSVLLSPPAVSAGVTSAGLAITALVFAALLCATARGLESLRPASGADRLAIVGLGAVAGACIALWRRGDTALLAAFAPLALALLAVFGVQRICLSRSRALPTLTRTALAGIVGALIVAGAGL